MQELIQLKKSDIDRVRNQLIIEQDGKCLISGEDITKENTGVSLDHQHKFKKDINGVDGAGLIRGALSRESNVLEGKIWNACTRHLRPKNVQERIEYLERLIAFYKLGTKPMIHPNEAIKEKRVSKSNYNRLAKLYKASDAKKKFPDYPKSGKLTKLLGKLFEEYNIPPYN